MRHPWRSTCSFSSVAHSIKRIRIPLGAKYLYHVFCAVLVPVYWLRVCYYFLPMPPTAASAASHLVTINYVHEFSDSAAPAVDACARLVRASATHIVR